LVYLLILAVALFSDSNQIAIFATPWPLHIGMIYMVWKRAGLVLVDDFVIVRKGIIGVDYIIFPAYKLQVVDHVQTLLMKRHALSNIIFHTASRTAKVAYLPSQFVRDLMDYCVFSIESSNKSWM
jgi:putative membrane protein